MRIGCPRVVALLPAWNSAEFILPTLEALSAQTYPNLEILVSVDLSSDGTADICETYRRTDARVRVLIQTERLGFVGNTRALLDEARGDYFSWAWHDDILAPDYIVRLVGVLEGAPRAVCAFTDLELHRMDGHVETLTYTVLDDVHDPVERAKRVLWLPDNWWLPNRGVFRASAAQRVGGFKRHWAGEYTSDWPWALHMAILGEHIRVPEVMCRKFFKATSLSLSTSWRRNRWTNAAVLWSCGREIRHSDLPLMAKARLHLTLGSVFRAFMTRRRGGPPRHRMHAHPRAVSAHEGQMRPDGEGHS